MSIDQHDRPKRRRALELAARDRILAAALSAFSERGFDGASTRDIAAAAGVAQGLLTYHYESKQALWEASVGWAFGLLFDEFKDSAEIYRDLDPQTRLRAALKRFVRFVARHPEVHRLMMHEGPSDSPRLRWIVSRYLKPFFAEAESFIRPALPRVDMVHFYYALVGAMSHAFAVAPEFRLLTGRDPMESETVETHASIVVDWLIDGALVQQAAIEQRELLAARNV
ncbi:MAG: TetR/AcrR family transcriptional regulator [Novosphingobium sp.]|jgi:TetR/AcrR family transcriptional regulator|uniref:TetR/AcrR family transcriptional regulator n=1 Tax=Novosphingobium sp. TaxID=1874826 RepID=UPI00391C0088|nr:CerR family C-terminal domain-containing protein [Novosphingobium sp.]